MMGDWCESLVRFCVAGLGRLVLCLFVFVNVIGAASCDGPQDRPRYEPDGASRSFITCDDGIQRRVVVASNFKLDLSCYFHGDTIPVERKEVLVGNGLIGKSVRFFFNGECVWDKLLVSQHREGEIVLLGVLRSGDSVGTFEMYVDERFLLTAEVSKYARGMYVNMDSRVNTIRLVYYDRTLPTL